MTIAPPFIKSINFPQSIVIGASTTLLVHAEWPNPAWKHVDMQIFMNETEQEIKINYMGQRGKGMAIMKIEPFTFTVDVVFPTAGEWTVLVAMRGGVYRQTCSVVPA